MTLKQFMTTTEPVGATSPDSSLQTVLCCSHTRFPLCVWTRGPNVGFQAPTNPPLWLHAWNCMSDQFEVGLSLSHQALSTAVSLRDVFAAIPNLFPAPPPLLWTGSALEFCTFNKENLPESANEKRLLPYQSDSTDHARCKTHTITSVDEDASMKTQRCGSMRRSMPMCYFTVIGWILVLWKTKHRVQRSRSVRSKDSFICDVLRLYCRVSANISSVTVKLAAGLRSWAICKLTAFGIEHLVIL